MLGQLVSKPFEATMKILTTLDDDAKPMAAKYLAKWRPDFATRLLPERKDELKTENMTPSIMA